MRQVRVQTRTVQKRSPDDVVEMPNEPLAYRGRFPEEKIVIALEALRSGS